jgi:hypothetical protein
MTRMVRYQIKPEAVADNEALVGAVFKALHAQRPAGLRYACFKLDDGLSFMHLVDADDAAASQALTALAAFKDFTAGLAQRCEHAAVRTELTEIGSYGLFDTPD